VLLGTVVYILTFLYPWHVVPTVGLLFGVWGACWWIGRISPLAEGPAKFRAWLQAAAFAAVVWVFMFPGIARFFPGHYSPPGLAEVMAERQGAATREGAALNPIPLALPQPAGARAVLVDFTADWCPTCKEREASVLNAAAVVEAVRANGVAALRADWTHEPPDISQMLEVLGGKQVPVVAVFSAKDPNHPTVFRGFYTQDVLLAALAKAN